MESKTFLVNNISCGSCVMTIRRELEALEGIRRVEGDPASKRVTVVWESPATWDKISLLLTEMNYAPA